MANRNVKKNSGLYYPFWVI